MTQSYVIGLLAAFCVINPTVSWADEISSIEYAIIDGETVTQAQGATINTPFAIASVGKTFTAVAVLHLVQDGTLHLNDPVSKWLPVAIADGFGGLEDVRVHHLLQMTSGLPDYYDDEYIADALENAKTVQNPTTALTYAFGYPAAFAVGQGFDYSNTNYVLLGLIIENATSKPYAQVLDELIFDPLDMDDSFVFGTRALPVSFPNGHENTLHFHDYYQGMGFGDGGVISTAVDLVTFYNALFDKKVLLDDATLQVMLADPLGEEYGMGIQVEGGVVGHSGGDLGFSSDIRMDLETGDVAVSLIAEADADTSWTYRQLGYE